MMKVLRFADTALDNSKGDDREQAFSELFSMLKGDQQSPQQIQSDFTIVQERLSEESLQLFKQLGELTLSIAGIATITQLVPQVLKEGQLTGEAFLSLFGGKVTDPYRKYINQLGGFANLFDNFVDFNSDHAKGEIAIEPDLSNRVYMINAMMPLACNILTSTKPEIIASFARRTVDTVQSWSSKID